MIEDNNINKAPAVDSAKPTSPWEMVAAAINQPGINKVELPAAERVDKASSNKSDDASTKLLLDALHNEISEHENFDRNKSYLAKAFDLVYSPDSKSMKELKSLSDEYSNAIKSGDTVAVEKMKGRIEDKIKSDMQAVMDKAQADQLASTFTKTMFLFLNGYAGWAGTVAAYSLDQMRPQSSAVEQLIDGTTGAAKGALMKGLTQIIGNSELPLAAKGMALGASSRVLELALNQRTYLNADSNSFDLKRGLSNTLLASINPMALATDATVFTIAQGLNSGSNYLMGANFATSPFVKTVSTGYVFGATSGALTELQRERAAGENIDIAAIAWHGARDGALSALAASLGGVQAEMAWRKSNEFLFQREGESGRFSFAKTKYYEVKANQVSKPEGEYVQTLENGKQGEFAAKGSWIVERSPSEKYPITEAEFAKRWQPVAGKPGVFSPKPVPTDMVELSKAVDIKTSWGDMHGNAGDFLVRYGDGNFAIVARNVMPETYAGMDPASIAKLNAIKLQPSAVPVS